MVLIFKKCRIASSVFPHQTILLFVRYNAAIHSVREVEKEEKEKEKLKVD
jgi:hypothetical protein